MDNTKINLNTRVGLSFHNHFIQNLRFRQYYFDFMLLCWEMGVQHDTAEVCLLPDIYCF